jgi:MYXO-CTERM domain-containing protein
VGFILRALLALGAILVTLTPAASSRAEPGARADHFFDRAGREVRVERGAREGGLTAVRVTYPERSRRVEALVDRSAIVALPPGTDPRPLEAHGARIVRPLMPAAGLWLVEDESGGDGIDIAHRLGRGPGIRHATPNFYLRVTRREPFVPNDERFSGQWYLEKIGMPEAWGLSRGASDVGIVIVDTGCDLAHPDLAAKMDVGLDVVDGDADASYDPDMMGGAHGTHCAGVAAAITNNGVGVAGTCPECRLHCVRFLTDEPTPVSSAVDVFEFALEVDAAVVSNSWGYVEPTPVPPALSDAIGVLFDQGRGGRGAIVVFAAGNDDRELGDDEIEAARGVLNVGAINNYDESTPFTNSGASLDLVAPTGTLTTDISGADGDDPGDYMSSFGGTSSSCPVVAGVAGVVVAAAPDKSAAEIHDVLVRTTRRAPYAVPDASGHDPIYGYGIVDPPRTLRVVLGIEEAPPLPGPEEEAEESCACRAAKSPRGSMGPWLLALAALLALLAWRRRRPRAAQGSARRMRSTFETKSPKVA